MAPFTLSGGKKPNLLAAPPAWAMVSTCAGVLAKTRPLLSVETTSKVLPGMEVPASSAAPDASSRSVEIASVGAPWPGTDGSRRTALACAASVPSRPAALVTCAGSVSEAAEPVSAVTHTSSSTQGASSSDTSSSNGSKLCPGRISPVATATIVKLVDRVMLGSAIAAVPRLWRRNRTCANASNASLPTTGPTTGEKGPGRRP